jgi:hypothetical protein
LLLNPSTRKTINCHTICQVAYTQFSTLLCIPSVPALINLQKIKEVMIT